MFTDIVGSTALRDALVAAHGESDGDRRYREQFLDPHHERIRTFLGKHRGFEVKTNSADKLPVRRTAERCGMTD